tara:strand:+ start:1110 stop:1229 length:120 start_codon:yes stop_codon:yes gene_type:complete
VRHTEKAPRTLSTFGFLPTLNAILEKTKRAVFLPTLEIE